MAEYLTNDTELTGIADAIRAKGGTGASLLYPTGFVSAIQAIETTGGVPEGGTTGQVLQKASNTDYDCEWATAAVPEGVPSGGTTGQVLRKASATDYDCEWATVSIPAASSALSVTLASGSWTSATPPTQTVTATGVTSSNNVIIGLAASITSAQYDAACAAKLVCTAQGTNSLTFTCYGTEPTENIPISVVILG